MCTNFESSDVEGVVIITSDKLSPDNLLLNILNVKILPSAVVHNNVQQYEWKVDTKYYSAVVNLFSVQEKAEFDPVFCDAIRATVLYFDGQEPSDFENILSWMPFLKNINSEVQLLVCDCCKDEELHKKNVLNWCVENEFELIELNPVDGSDDEDENAFAKSRGYGRVVEALQSHMWSNLIMKKESRQSNNLPKQQNEVTSESSHSVSNDIACEETAANLRKMKVDDEELLLEEHFIQNVLQQDDPDIESFETLFVKFASMKEKASSLNGEERKKYAEKVAVAFWKAMGGDDDEIEGLDDE